MSGATGQNLKETFYIPIGSELRSIEVDPGSNLLRPLLGARPGLRDEARSVYPTLMTGPEARKVSVRGYLEPLFLFGAVWERTASYIGTYGDVDTLLAWKYLESDLSPGHSFSHQLIPALANDIWLYATVWSEGDCMIGGRDYAYCIEVIYAVDFGVEEVTNESGDVIDSYHPYAAGIIVYAPQVGPIRCRERMISRERDPFTGALGPPIASERAAELVEAQVTY